MMDKCVHRLHTGSDPIITDSFSGGVSSFVTQLQTTAQYVQALPEKLAALCLIHVHSNVPVSFATLVF